MLDTPVTIDLIALIKLDESTVYAAPYCVIIPLLE